MARMDFLSARWKRSVKWMADLSDRELPLATAGEVRRWLATGIPDQVRIKGIRRRWLSVIFSASISYGAYLFFAAIFLGEEIRSNRIPDHPLALWSVFVILLALSIFLVALTVAEYVKPVLFELRLSRNGFQQPFFFWPKTRTWAECGPFEVRQLVLSSVVQSRLLSGPAKLIVLPPKQFGLKGKELAMLLNQFQQRSLEKSSRA